MGPFLKTGRPNLKNTTKYERDIIDLEVPQMAKKIEERWPDVWHRMFTRSVDAPNSFYSSKALAVGLVSALEELRYQAAQYEAGNRQYPFDSNLAICAGLLEQHDFPTYYVSSPLIDALKHSNPPEQMKWSDITLPFPSLVFMLPRGAIQEPDEISGKDCILVGVAKLEAGRQFSMPTIGKFGPINEDRITVFWSIAPSGLIFNDCTFPTTHALVPVADWIDRATEAHNSEYTGPGGRFSSYLAGVVANLILVMEARKELVEPGNVQLRRRHKGKADLCSPTFIGRNYNILRRQQGESTGAHFTELGWRAGHFKRQHFGPRREQTKTIFVDPYIAFTRGLVPK